MDQKVEPTESQKVFLAQPVGSRFMQTAFLEKAKHKPTDQDLTDIKLIQDNL